MKQWLIFILLLITTVATFVPCCLEDNCAAEQLLTTTDEHEEQEEGNCSPFSACRTCAGLVDLVKYIQLVRPEKLLPVHQSGIISLSLSTYSATLFQPPRFA